MKLDNLPEEVPTRVMEAYLSKYLINPKMTIKVLYLTEVGMGMIEIDEATVSHKGIRRPIPRRIWVGPGVSARVKSNSQMPWDQYKILCSLCKEEGHKAWDCTEQTQCYRCKATGHASEECPYCHKCRKYGHESSKCHTGLNNDTDTNTEKGTNQKDTPETNKTCQNYEWTFARKKHQTKQNTKPAAMEEKTNNTIPATAGVTQKDTMNPVDSSNSEESMDEGDNESSWHKVGRKRRHSNASSSNSHSKPKKGSKEESNSPPYHKTKKNKQINKQYVYAARMCVCVCTHVYVYVYVYIYICMWVCMCIFI